MRLTKQSTYAIRALMYCAVNHPRLSQVSAIASAYGISESFLFKLIKPLVENGILETVRGRRGGIRLARGPESITLFDSVSLTEDGFVLADCFGSEGIDCPLVENCAFHNTLAAALTAFHNELAAKTIADVVADTPDIAARLGIAR